MKIAIFGATSQIAKGLIAFLAKDVKHHCILFSRSQMKVQAWLEGLNTKCAYVSKGYADFENDHYDAIVNFVGVGDPARAKAMGAKIFEVTYQYDQLALDYIQKKPKCKYIFLSSGAVYGDVFKDPVTEQSVAKIPINQLDETYWYTIAKLHAEARHRTLLGFSIVDVRVFNYFSHTQDMSARFFITDIMRAIQNKIVLKTSSENIVRDFLHPDDFHQLIECIFNAEDMNIAVDCYSKEPVDKITLLKALKKEFGLDYEFTDQNIRLNATGNKLNYYSLNTHASDFGYSPSLTSLEGVLIETGKVLNGVCRDTQG